MGFTLFRSKEDELAWKKKQAAKKLREKEDAAYGKGVGTQDIPLGLSEAEYEKESLDRDISAYKAKEAERFERWQKTQGERNKAFGLESKKMERSLRVKGANEEQLKQFRKNRQSISQSQQQAYKKQELDLSGKPANSSDPKMIDNTKQKGADPGMTTGDKTQATLAAANYLRQQTSDGTQTTDTGMGAAEGAVGGATAGASIGMYAGPKGAAVGAAIGAVVGGTMGALKSKSARKAAQRKARAEAEAKYRESLANIEMDKADKINVALQNMQVGFQNSLMGKLNVRL